MNKETEIRKIALETLIQYENSGIPSHVFIKNVLDKYDYLSDLDKALISRIVKGVIERRIELDHVLDIYSNTKHTKMKKPVRIILEMGAYQILHMDSYDSLAVNISVDLAKKKGLFNLSGYINAVLRKISADKDNIQYPQKGEKDYLTVKYSMPHHIVDLLLKQYDEDTLEKMFESTLSDNSIRIRIREDIKDDEKRAVFEELEKNGIKTEMSEDTDNIFAVKGTGNIARLDCFKKGYIYIQDMGSYILCKNVEGREDMEILDCCAAPGGKSIFVSQRFPSAKIISCDVSEEKLLKIKENIERCKAGNISIRLCDATVFEPEFKERFDVVICDVPCSGLGVMGKKQDIKYNITEEGLKSLYGLQEKILENVSGYVKESGTLLYSTCTVNKEENDKRVEKFIKEHKDYEFAELSYVPDKYKKDLKKGSLSLIQGRDDSDGFFISVMKRVKNNG